MATNQITGSVTGNITVETGGTYTSPFTVTSTGTVTGTTFVQDSGTVLNSGILNTGGGPNSQGVHFFDGGAITNEVGGTIVGGTSSGASAIYATSTSAVASTVDNLGTLTGYRGIQFLSNGSITNEMGGSIIGADDGIFWRNAAGNVVNDGSIVATGGPFADAVNFYNGGSVTNGADGVIRGANNGLAINGAAGTVGNSGTIIGTRIWGVEMNTGGSISNSGTIGGGDTGVLVGGAAGTLDNSGTVYVIGGQAHSVDSDVGAAVEFDGGGSVTNEAGASILGGGKGVYLRDGGGTVTNLTGGTISGYQFGVKITGEPGLVDNHGLIDATANYYIPEGIGVYLGAGGTVINETGATIQAYYSGIQSGNAPITIDNHGTIAATGTSDAPPSGGMGGIGISLYTGGTIANYTGGSISGRFIGINSNEGLTLTNASGATISSYKYVVNVNGDAGIIVNHGTIVGGAFANSQGVYLGAGGTVTNDGSITATHDGVYVKAGDATVINSGIIAATGSGTADVGVDLQSGTVDNAGTIAGDVYSVRFEGTGANRLVVHAGAVFDGHVFANSGGANTLELTSGAVGGAISGLGIQYAGFQTVAIDAGASWDIAGTSAGFGGSTITGFHAGDRLDLTDIAFQAGDTATYSGGVLTIENAGHTVLASIDMTGSFGGHSFDVLNDGHGGSYVEEDGVACYCRGTLILTSRGEVPVEDLKIGDRLVTHWGAKRPIRWIGTRSYNGRFAAERKDILPVTIAAGALGDNIPRRDLSVSPLHAMFLDGMLIPANALVNGTSITQARHVEAVEYFHVELDSHDVIVAEGALSETFVDDDSRGQFQNAAEYYLLYPRAWRKPVDYCAPVVEDGEELEHVRRWIAARAGELRQAA